MLLRRENKREGAGQAVVDDRERKREERTKREVEHPKTRDGTRAGSCQQRAETNQRGESHLAKVENVVTVVVKVVEKVVGELVEKLNVGEVMGKLEDLRRTEDITSKGPETTAGGKGDERAVGKATRTAKERENGREVADFGGGAMGERAKEAKERAPEPMEPPSTPNQQKAFRQVFDSILERAGRTIDFQGFQSLLRAENLTTSEAKAHKAFWRLDSNRDGQVGFGDFCRAMTSTHLFLQFVAELPNSCPSCELQKGYVGDTVFFDILLRFLIRQVISEDSIRSITHYYYLKWQKPGPSAKGDRAAGQPKAGSTFLGMSLRSIQALIESSEPEEQSQGRYLPGRLVVAFYEVFQMLVGDREGCVGTTDLLSVMYQMQIPLKNPLIPDDLKFTALNSGKEVDFETFLTIMSNPSTFTQFMTPQCLECKSSRSPELLFFQVLLKLLATPALRGRSRGVITSYYHGKFRESLHLLPGLAQRRAKQPLAPLHADGEREPDAELGKEGLEMRKATITLRRSARSMGIQRLQRQAKGPRSKARRSKGQRYPQFRSAIRDPYFQQVFQEYAGARRRGQSTQRHPEVRENDEEQGRNDAQQVAQN